MVVAALARRRAELRRARLPGRWAGRKRRELYLHDDSPGDLGGFVVRSASGDCCGGHWHGGAADEPIQRGGGFCGSTADRSNEGDYYAEASNGKYAASSGSSNGDTDSHAGCYTARADYETYESPRA